MKNPIKKNRAEKSFVLKSQFKNNDFSPEIQDYYYQESQLLADQPNKLIAYNFP